MSTPSSDSKEIDLIDLIIQVWKARLTLILFVVMSVSLAALYLLQSEKKFASTIVIEISNVPFFESAENISLNYERMFRKKSNFDSWALKNSSAAASFSHFNPEQDVGGVTLISNMGGLLIDFQRNAPHFLNLRIKSNDLLMLEDYYNYASYVGNILEQYYISKSKSFNKIYEGRLINNGEISDMVMDKIISIELFGELLQQGESVLIINRPTYPTLQNGGRSGILFISAVLGAGLGCLYIILSNVLFTIRKKAITG